MVTGCGGQALGQHSRMIEQPGIVIQMAANEPLHTLPERQVLLPT